MASNAPGTFYISFLEYISPGGTQFLKFYPEQDGKANSRMLGNGFIYAYCNRHGLSITKYRTRFYQAHGLHRIWRKKHIKILLLNGSPKGEASNTLMLSKAFLDGMGRKYERIGLIKKSIAPCMGCFCAGRRRRENASSVIMPLRCCTRLLEQTWSFGLCLCIVMRCHHM